MYLKMNWVPLILWLSILCVVVFESSYKVDARLPFTLGVRDSIMIAHSFHNHPSFGPAGGMVSFLHDLF